MASLFCFSLVGYVGKVVVFVDGLVDVVLWPREENVRNSSRCNHKLARMGTYNAVQVVHHGDAADTNMVSHPR